MIPQNPKRTLTKEESSNKDIASKRPRTSEITTPVNNEAVKTGVEIEEVTGDTSSGALLKYRRALSPKDLPPECLYGSRIAFRPAIRNLVGTLDPWESPADADVIRIWNSCFSKHKFEGPKKLQTVVLKLVEDTIQNWRRDIASTAVECLNTDLKNFSNKQGTRITHAAWLLGEDKKDRKRPFYYKNYGNGTRPSGIFQSPIIAATLATHLSSTSYLSEESRLQNYPTGALALSILAVKRALTWAKTGVDRILKTSEAHFSRANWGDHYKLQDGQYVLTKTASNVVAAINKLRDIQWDRILTEAERYATEKNALKALHEEEADQSDFELEDWDDDFE